MFVETLLWSAFQSAMQAQMAAEAARRNAELQQWLVDEEMRRYKRAGSIEVEARWITDVPRLEAS